MDVVVVSFFQLFFLETALFNGVLGMLSKEQFLNCLNMLAVIFNCINVCLLFGNQPLDLCFGWGANMNLL